MPRDEMDVQKDLDQWEAQLDRHLGHCATCDERVERYCREGVEISVMVIRLMMEKLRVQAAADRGDATFEGEKSDSTNSAVTGNEP